MWNTTLSTSEWRNRLGKCYILTSIRQKTRENLNTIITLPITQKKFLSLNRIKKLIAPKDSFKVYQYRAV